MTAETDRYTAGMRRMWGGADYRALADRLAPAAEVLVHHVPAGPVRVLDLGAGTGNVAASAAARGAAVTAVDLSPRMVELGRARTADQGVEWQEADAEDLPFPDGSFDAVLSAFGLIFAPRSSTALAEARRVLAPGGVLAFTSWTPDGFMGAMTTTMRRWLPQPAGVADVLDWGREPVVRDWTARADFAVTTVSRSSLPWHFDSPGAMTAFLLAHSPTHAASAAGLGDRAGPMFEAVEELAGPAGRPVRIDAEHLVVTAS